MMNKKILKLAQENPGFRRKLIATLKKVAQEVALESKVRFRPDIPTKEIVEAAIKHAKEGKVLTLGKGRTTTRLYFEPGSGRGRGRGWAVSNPKSPYPDFFGNDLDRAAVAFVQAWMRA